MFWFYFVFKTLPKVFLNNEQHKDDKPLYPKLDIDGSGCEEFWNACFLHDPTGSVGSPITGGCNPKRSKYK